MKLSGTFSIRLSFPMAAIQQLFDTLAPPNAHFSEEMAASIATALNNTAQDTPYNLASQYIDAFVRYIDILDNNFGAPVGDSVAFVMQKYGVGLINSDNPNIAAFVQARLEGLQTFSD